LDDVPPAASAMVWAVVSFVVVSFPFVPLSDGVSACIASGTAAMFVDSVVCWTSAKTVRGEKIITARKNENNAFFADFLPLIITNLRDSI
jgi:hypothetical protein